MKGFRRRILKLARDCGLSGLIFNDQHETNLVRMIVSGRKTAVSTFIIAIEDLIASTGV